MAERVLRVAAAEGEGEGEEEGGTQCQCVSGEQKVCLHRGVIEGREGREVCMVGKAEERRVRRRREACHMSQCHRRRRERRERGRDKLNESRQRTTQPL